MNNSRKSFVNSTAIQFRALCQQGLGVQQIHYKLSQLEFDHGKQLSQNDIAAIVNYCYYPGNTDTLRTIMKGSI